MVSVNVSTGVPHGENNPANQREVLDEQDIKKRRLHARFPLSKSVTYRNEVADFFVYPRRERDKSAFPWPWLPLPLHKTLHWKHVFPPASNDTKQWLSNKYPGKDTVNKPPLCPLRPRDKRRKPEAVK